MRPAWAGSIRFTQSDSGKLLARFGAGPAGVGAFLHIADAIAAVRTLFANFSAGPAHRPVERGMSQQNVCAAAAHFRTGHHQAEMLGLDMLAASLETVRHRGLDAGPIASKALLDAVAQFRFYRVHRDLP
jgi:hypothetical protein